MSITKCTNGAGNSQHFVDREIKIDNRDEFFGFIFAGSSSKPNTPEIVSGEFTDHGMSFEGKVVVRERTQLQWS